MLSDYASLRLLGYGYCNSKSEYKRCCDNYPSHFRYGVGYLIILNKTSAHVIKVLLINNNDYKILNLNNIFLVILHLIRFNSDYLPVFFCTHTHIYITGGHSTTF